MQITNRMWSRLPDAAVALQSSLRRRVVLIVLAIFLANGGATAQQPSNALSSFMHRPSAVFLGDSITYFWGQKRSSFFTINDYVDLGVGGQTSAVMLSRFSRDVVPQKPSVVLILAGTNDVAENDGPVTDDQIIANLKTMFDIASANKIKVVVGSVPPADTFGWNPKIVPGARIALLNAKIKAWAAAQGITYADFWSAMALPDGGMNPNYSSDSVHPNEAGYSVMEPIAKAAIEEALKASR